MSADYQCCEAKFFFYLLVIALLVLFAGLMSALTLGLMSLSLADLEVLAKFETLRDHKHVEKDNTSCEKAALIVVHSSHLQCCSYGGSSNFLDSLVSAWGAILISVTLILLFGEIIPQSICSRYGLAIGVSVEPVVQVLVWICFPIAYPISKLLDYLLGKDHVALFRRAELKTLVNLHGNEVGKGGE